MSISVGKVCFRCGAKNFATQQIPECKAAKENCEKCGMSVVSLDVAGDPRQPHRRLHGKNETKIRCDAFWWWKWIDSSKDFFDGMTGTTVLAKHYLLRRVKPVKKIHVNDRYWLNISTLGLREIVGIDVKFAPSLPQSEKNK